MTVQTRRPFFWYYDVILTTRDGDMETLWSRDGIGYGTWARSLRRAKVEAKRHLGKRGVVKAEVIKRSSTTVAVLKRREGQ